MGHVFPEASIFLSKFLDQYFLIKISDFGIKISIQFWVKMMFESHFDENHIFRIFPLVIKSSKFENKKLLFFYFNKNILIKIN